MVPTLHGRHGTIPDFMGQLWEELLPDSLHYIIFTHYISDIMIYYDIYKCDFAVFLGLDKGTGLLILQKSFSNCNRSSWGRKSSCLNHGLSTRSPLCCRYFLGRSSPADALSAGHVPWKPRSSFCSKHAMGKPWLQVSTPKMDQAGQSWQTGKEWIVI